MKRLKSLAQAVKDSVTGYYESIRYIFQLIKDILVFFKFFFVGKVWVSTWHLNISQIVFRNYFFSKGKNLFKVRLGKFKVQSRIRIDKRLSKKFLDLLKNYTLGFTPVPQEKS